MTNSYPSGIFPESMRKGESNTTLPLGFDRLSMLHLLFAMLRGGEGLCALIPSPYACIEKGEERKECFRKQTTKWQETPPILSLVRVVMGNRAKKQPLLAGMDPHDPVCWWGAGAVGTNHHHLGNHPPVAGIRGFGENWYRCRAINRGAHLRQPGTPRECWGKWEAGYCKDKWLWNPVLFFLQ